jgi:hypothetical protein
LSLQFIFRALIATSFMSHSAFALDQAQALHIAKANFKLANAYLYEVIFGCLTHPRECGVSSKESQLINRIYYELLKSPRTSLQFDSEERKPGMFQVDGMVRIAFTANRPGSEIFVNEDMIVKKAGEILVPWTIEESVAVLTHEYGHHHSMIASSHEELDALGQKLSQHMMSYARRDFFKSSELGLNADAGDVSVIHYVMLGNQNQRQEKSLLFVQTSRGVADLTGMVSDRVECPKAFYRDELEFEGPAFRFHLPEFEINADAATAQISITAPKATMFCINQLPNKPAIYESFENFRKFSAQIPLRMSQTGAEVDYDAIQFEYVKPDDRRYY